jgi:hypothetical protein
LSRFKWLWIVGTTQSSDTLWQKVTGQDNGTLSYKTDYDWQDTDDPKNLSVVVRMSFPQTHSEERYGLLSYFIYRLEIEFQKMRIPQDNNSGSIAFLKKM